MRKVNFFIIGQPKSGTTAMYKFLDQHPEVLFVEGKEPDFFSKDYHKSCDKLHKVRGDHYPYRTLEQYRKLFEKAKNEKIIGDGSTNYLYSKVAAKEIAKYNPDAKILLFVREPIQYLKSVYNHQRLRTMDDAKTFEEAMRLEAQRKKGERLTSNTKAPEYLFYRERVKYGEQIQRYFDNFPKKNIMIVVYDDFRENNEKVYLKVLDFLGVDKSFKPNFKERFNESRAYKNENF